MVSVDCAFVQLHHAPPSCFEATMTWLLTSHGVAAQAFKAANPGCVLQDFVRWHSPRDWIVADGEIADERGHNGHLSERHTEESNLWSVLWSATLPISAAQQHANVAAAANASSVHSAQAQKAPGQSTDVNGGAETLGGSSSWRSGVWGFGSVIGGLARESAGGLAQLATDVTSVGTNVAGAASGLGLQLAGDSLEGLTALAGAVSTVGADGRPPREEAADSHDDDGVLDSVIDAAERVQEAAGGGGWDDDDWGDAGWNEDGLLDDSDRAKPLSATRSGMLPGVASPPLPAAAAPSAALALAMLTEASPSTASPASDCLAAQKTPARFVGQFGASVLAEASGLARESAGGLRALVSDVTSVAGGVAGKAGSVGRQLAGESLDGVSALAHDSTAVAARAGQLAAGSMLGETVRDVVKVAGLVTEMVASDALSAADAVGGEGVSSGLLAASADARAVGEAAANNLAATSQLAAASLVSGIKDNVQLLDAVGRTTVGSVRSAVGEITSLSTELAQPTGAQTDVSNGSQASDEAAGQHEADSLDAAPPHHVFEVWMDTLGGGGLQLQGLEALRDGCALKVRAKMSKLAPSQRAALEEALAAVELVVANDDDGWSVDRGDDDDAHRAGGGPPVDRLAVHAAAGTEAAAAVAVASAAAASEKAVVAITNGSGDDVRFVGADKLAEGGLIEGLRLQVAQENVELLGAIATRCLARVCKEALHALCSFATRCRA